MKSRKWWRRRNKGAWKLMHRPIDIEEVANMIGPYFYKAWLALNADQPAASPPPEAPHE